MVDKIVKMVKGMRARAVCPEYYDEVLDGINRLKAEQSATTYRVVEGSHCTTCCGMSGECGLSGIPETEIFRSLADGKLCTLMADGCECYAMVEVEPEKAKGEA